MTSKTPYDRRWNALEEQYGAVFEPGAFFREERLLLRLASCRVTLAEQYVHVTGARVAWSRFRTSLVNGRRLWFKTVRRYPIHALRGRLSRRVVTIGDPEFDSTFFTRGSDAEVVASLFASKELRQCCIKRGHDLHVNLTKPGWLFGRGQSTLTVKAVKPRDDLDALISVMTEILAQLQNIGLRPLSERSRAGRFQGAD